MESSHIWKTVLFILVLFLSGVWGSQSALGGDEIQCAQYAKTAISQNQQNMEKACGFTGPAWSSDYNHHNSWCLRVPKEQADAGTKQRVDDLTNRCAAAQPSQPQGGGAMSGPGIRCEQYARDAIARNEENISKGCGFGGPAWSGNYSHHYDWCMRVPRNQADAGTNQRVHELNINCASSRRNPQPMENPPLKELEQPKLLTPTSLPNLVPKVETQNGLHIFDGKTIRVKVRNKGTGYVWGDEYKVGIRPAGASNQNWMGTAVGKKMVPGQEVIVDVPWSPGTVKLQDISAFVAEVDIENKVYEGDPGETDNVSQPFQLMDMSGLKVQPTEPQTAPLAKKQINADLAIEGAGFFGNYFSFSLENKGPDPVDPKIVRMMKIHTTFMFSDPSKNHKCTIYMEDFASSGDMPLGKAQGAVRSISLAPSLNTRFGCPHGTYSSGMKFSYALVTLEWPMDVFNFGNMPTQLVDPDTSNNQSIYHYPKNYKPFGK
jgi:hypothetical protein